MQNYPLAWPPGWRRTPAADRKFAKFTTKRNGAYGVYQGALSIADGIKRVLYELGRLGAKDVVISTMLRTRLDGFPYSDQKAPADQGAAVYWQYDTGHTRVMAIDTYTHVADNLAAIAATLEAMRAIERHGGAQILDRAFTGFEVLPAPEVFDPWRELGLPRGATAGAIQEAFRHKAPAAHPDTGGTAETFRRLLRARTEALAEAVA